MTQELRVADVATWTARTLRLLGSERQECCVLPKLRAMPRKYDVLMMSVAGITAFVRAVTVNTRFYDPSPWNCSSL